MTSPTTTARPPRPSASRCAAAAAVGASSRSAAWSVRTRLTSSGIDRLKERRPASRWAVGMWSFTAARAAASVELVSPYTSAQSGRWRARTGSIAASIRPVWTPWVPEPTPRCSSGGLMRRSEKNTSESSGS